MADYYAIPTHIGEAKLANALALGVPVQITHLAVGDGEGLGAQGTPLPNPAQTALISERRRAPINTLATDSSNPNVLVAEQVIPEDVGGWWIREMGLIDADGDLIAICNTPPTYKPVLASGSGRTQVVRMQVIVSDVAAVTLKIDPAVVLATRKYADDQRTAHEQSHQRLIVASGQTYDSSQPEQLRDAVKRLAGAQARTLTAGSHVLTVADAGLVMLDASAGNVSATLPAAAALAGAQFDFVRVDETANTATITRAGADTISGATSVSINKRLSLKSDGVSAWKRATSDIATQAQTIAGTDDDTIVTPKKLRLGFAASVAFNGYIALPSWLGGLIIQWGSMTSLDGAVTVTAALPLTFPSARYMTLASPRDQAGGTWGVVLGTSGAYNTLSQVGFSIYGAGSYTELSINYITVGK